MFLRYYLCYNPTSRLDIPGEDVARQFVLDLGVFIVSLITLVVDVVVVVKLKLPTHKDAATTGSGDRQDGANGTGTVDDNKEETEIEARHVDNERGMQYTYTVYIIIIMQSAISSVYNNMHTMYYMFMYICSLCKYKYM